MKKLSTLCFFMIVAVVAFGQNYSMNGTFVCRNPPFSGIDSTKLIFTPTNYEYYINNSVTPASSGTYQVKYIGGGNDTIVISEVSGACINNGGKNPIKFKILKSSSPKVSVIIEETSLSKSNCPTHSDKIVGEYESVNGVIVGLNEFKVSGLNDKSFITFFPNPASRSFTIKSNIQIQEIHMYDLVGNQQKFEFTDDNIITAEIPAGMYIVLIMDSEGRYYQNRILLE